MATIEDENKRLREENDRLRDELRFLRTEVGVILDPCHVFCGHTTACIHLLHLWQH